MATKIYTEEQLSVLRAHPCIEKCSEKYIIFTGTFRKEAVRLYEHIGLSPKQIFVDLGFPEFIVGSKVPKGALKRWREVVTKNGLTALEDKKRGRKPGWRGEGGRARKTVVEEDIRLLSKEEQIIYLQAQVAYLKAEIAFRKGVRTREND